MHTNYTDRDDDDLKAIFKTGKHNHGFNQNSSEYAVGRGRKRRYARVEADEEEGYDEDGDDGESDDEDGDDGESGEDEETEEDKKCRYSSGLVILNYLQYLNVLSDEMFKEALKNICSFEFDLIYYNGTI